MRKKRNRVNRFREDMEENLKLKENLKNWLRNSKSWMNGESIASNRLE